MSFVKITVLGIRIKTYMKRIASIIVNHYRKF